MFKICNDKTYYVVQTTSEDVVVEIYTKKDGRGSGISLHEMHLDLCRAIRKLQHDGYTIMKVYPAMGDRRESIDVLSMPEFIQSAKCPDNDVEEAVVFSYFESGATFQLPCKVNKKTHEIFDVTCAAMPCDDDCFSYAEVEINGKDYPVNFIDDILSENNVDDALDEFYRIQQTGEYWQPAGNKTLDDAIHECRWAILKDALMPLPILLAPMFPVILTKDCWMKRKHRCRARNSKSSGRDTFEEDLFWKICMC